MQRLLNSKIYKQSVLFHIVRAFVRQTSARIPYSIETMMTTMAVERPHYAYCLLGAARLARALDIQRISAIEFGVAGGNGIRFMCEFSKRIEGELGITIDCYGFDTGCGMPPPTGPKDLPYWFCTSQYIMEEDKLKTRVPDAKLVIGKLADTVDSFVLRNKPAPIGAIFNDVDYYSSTLDSFLMFKSVADYPDSFLPRIFMYFDDIVGGENEMYGDFIGQLAAISEFNASSSAVKISRNNNLLSDESLPFRWQIYYAHLFEHPLYEKYVGGERQHHIERALKLNDR